MAPSNAYHGCHRSASHPFRSAQRMSSPRPVETFEQMMTRHEAILSQRSVCFMGAWRCLATLVCASSLQLSGFRPSKLISKLILVIWKGKMSTTMLFIALLSSLFISVALATDCLFEDHGQLELISRPGWCLSAVTSSTDVSNSTLTVRMCDDPKTLNWTTSSCSAFGSWKVSSTKLCLDGGTGTPGGAVTLQTCQDDRQIWAQTWDSTIGE